MNLIDDIYYDKRYIELYLKPNEEIFEFEYKKDDNIFYNIAIKKPINKIGNITVSDNYYDLETVYGYGGIYCNSKDEIFLEKALKRYEEYCYSENIIAEFTRFHPFNNIHYNCTGFFDLLINDRQTVYIDTTLSKENRWANYTSKMRNILRKCEKELTFVRSNNIDNFIHLYESTMKKNNAEEFYFFDKEYFINLLNLKNVELYEVLYKDTVISSSFFMFSKEFGHYHLSANNYEYRKYNANYMILDSIFDISNSKDIPLFHLGGGRTNEEDDLLLKFKEKFSSHKEDFFIAGKVFNQDIYSKYINTWENQTKNKIKYFLKYRLEIENE